MPTVWCLLTMIRTVCTSSSERFRLNSFRWMSSALPVRAFRRVACGAVCVLGLCFWAAGAFAQSSDELAALQARAEAGESAAQFALGTRYLNGEGVAADNFEALRWFTLAADQDNANAQYNIAVMYLNGLGVIRDEAEALEWFLKAANNGDRQSQFTLGVVMFNGRMGAPQNTAEAYRWFTLAGAGGHQSAAANAVLIQELLPPAEVERVQREVQQWIEEFNSQQAGSPPS